MHLIDNIFNCPFTDETQEQPYENSKVTSKINKQIGANHNPFRYDSSESEDEAQEKVTEKKGAALKSFKRETFFFQENDERLKGNYFSLNLMEFKLKFKDIFIQVQVERCVIR